MSNTLKTDQEALSKKIKSFLFVEISQLNATIDEFTSSNQELIREIADYIFLSGGKRIRPVLTLLTAKLFNYNKDMVPIYLATAVEFIHTATLLHDDVVDDSILRRGNETANLKWGSKASILVGDYLFSQAFKLMALSKDLATLAILSGAAVRIAEGEVNQLVSSSSLNITYDENIEIISGKTAELFAAACCVSASIAGQDQKTIDALWNFGLNLGILFQIIDDQLDYFASEADFGKKLGDDFMEGKVTLPVILSYEYGRHKNFWETVFNKPARTQSDFEEAMRIMKEEEIDQRIAKIINGYYEIAFDSLKIFQDSEAKDILLEILNFTISRNY